MKFRRYKKELPVIELILYYAVAICTLGTTWVLKVVIKKALAETIQDQN